MGYSPSHKGYKCLAADGRLYISKDVIFNENSFPYPTLFPEPSLITSEVPDTTSTLTVLPSSQPASSSSNKTNTLSSLPSSVSPDHSEQHASRSEQLPSTSHSQPLNVTNIDLPQDQNPILSQDQTNTTIPQDQTDLLIPILSVPVQSLALLNPELFLLFY